MTSADAVRSGVPAARARELLQLDGLFTKTPSEARRERSILHNELLLSGTELSGSRGRFLGHVHRVPKAGHELKESILRDLEHVSPSVGALRRNALGGVLNAADRRRGLIAQCTHEVQRGETERVAPRTNEGSHSLPERLLVRIRQDRTDSCMEVPATRASSDLPKAEGNSVTVRILATTSK
jgi:hypothetical protein